MLRTYPDVSLFRYYVPQEIATVRWDFLTNSTKVSKTQSCDDFDGYFYLRWGGLPLSGIEHDTQNETILFNRKELYTKRFKSDLKLHHLNLNHPLPGEWFGMAFMKTKDKNILRKGLDKLCNVTLTSYLSFVKLKKYQELTILIPNSMTSQRLSSLKFYKFYSNSQVINSKLIISRCSKVREDKGQECPLKIYFRRIALPDTQNYDQFIDCSKNVTQECHFDQLLLAPSKWNYFLITSDLFSADFEIEFSLLLKMDECKYTNEVTSLHSSLILKSFQNFSSKLHSISSSQVGLSPISQDSCPHRIKLIRYNYPDALNLNYDYVNAFSFKYLSQNYSPFIDIPNSIISSTHSERNLTQISIFDFEIVPIIDSGGTLSIDLGFHPEINTTFHNISLLACIQHGFYSLTFNSCNLLAKVNTSQSGIQSLLIPYPKFGLWFILLKTECYFSDWSTNETHNVHCEFNSSSIFINIELNPCDKNSCGKNGVCQQSISSGIIYGFCLCKSGWRGLWCEDGSNSLSETELLFNFVLLTLSNLVFVPAIILTLFKKLYNEALTYFISMVSSMVRL